MRYEMIHSFWLEEPGMFGDLNTISLTDSLCLALSSQRDMMRFMLCIALRKMFYIQQRFV
jgi:hypothetical protein